MHRTKSHLPPSQGTIDRADAGRSRSPSPPTFRWRCRHCELCLAEMGPGMVDVAYKDLHWVFHGRGMPVVKCRRCGELNSLAVDDRSERAATA